MFTKKKENATLEELASEKPKKKKGEKAKAKSQKPKTKKTSINMYSAMTEKITGMGYSYSMLNLLKTMLFFSFIIVLLGYFHHLQIVFIAILILVILGLLPFSIYYQYKYLYEQKRFNQLKTYLKFMRLNFTQYKKIIIALRETQENFSPEEEMYQFIGKAIKDIEKGNSYRKALDIIEEPFKNSYITKLHAYMILAEMEGGESAYEALSTIDFENWESDTYLYQTQKYKNQKQNAIYTLLGLGISLSIVLIFDRMIKDPAMAEVFGAVFAKPTFQLATFVYIAIDIISFVMVKSMITGKWVREDE